MPFSLAGITAGQAGRRALSHGVSGQRMATQARLGLSRAVWLGEFWQATQAWRGPARNGRARYGSADGALAVKEGGSSEPPLLLAG